MLIGTAWESRARELGAEAALDRERSLRKRLAAQIDRFKVASPVAGRIEYALPIAAAAVIRDGDLLFRVIPDVAPGTRTK